MADVPVEPAPAIFGYTSKFSFEPGERVPVHVSCEQLNRYTAQLVRLRHGYEGPESPGFLETEIDAAANGEYPGEFHEPNTGSYVTVAGDHGVLSALIAWTIDFTFQSTTPEKPLQYFLGAWDASRHAGYAVVLEDGRVTLVFGDGEGGRVSFACDPQVEARAWYRVVATFDAATGDATLRLDPTNESVSSHLLPGTSQARGDHKRFRVPFPPAVAAVPFRIGAGSTGNAGFPEGVGHFNGKIGNPRVYPTAHVAHGASPLAEWDFARSNRSDRALLDDVVDVSGGGFARGLHQQPDARRDGLQLDGSRAELPACARTSTARSTSTTTTWTTRGGRPTSARPCPPACASGVYAARLRDGRDRGARPVLRAAAARQRDGAVAAAAADRLVPGLRERPHRSSTSRRRAR